jgi:branched-chain amino acid transport system substrate-binding protein
MRRRAVALGLAFGAFLSACTTSEDPIRVGALYPLSGTQGRGGVEEFQGVEVAAQLVNEDGGVNGRPIELVPVDTPSADAAPAAVDLLADQGITVVVGSYGSTISAPAAEQAVARGLVFWETGAVGEMTGGGGGELVFRFAPTGAVLGRKAIAFAADRYAPELGMAPEELRFAVAEVDDAYGLAVARGALDEIEDRGYVLAGEFPYDPRHVDMPALVRQLGQSRPDVLFVASYLEDAIAMRREIVARGLDLRVSIGTSSSYCMPEFGAVLGADAVGLFASDKPDSDALNPAGLTAAGRTLLGRAQAAYEQRFGGSMGAAALSGFSGAWALLHEVLPIADSTTAEAIARAAGSVRLPEGSLPNGSGVWFGAPGSQEAGANLLAASVVWQWVAPGERAVVWPPRYATAAPLLIEPGT